MRLFDVDFHIHSKYSGGTSKNMELPVIAEQAVLKGLDLVGTGDASNPSWLAHMKASLTEEEEGVYVYNKCPTRFLVTGEVEDEKRIHHLILFPGISSAESFYEAVRSHSRDIDRDGRPHLYLGAETIVDHASDAGALVGPAHAFTPWTAVYKEFDSLSDCYGSNLKKIKFLELGLSADTSMADRIKELEDLTFMSNSDTHSPWPHRLGREFNRIELDHLSFPEIVMALERKNGRAFKLNVGLDPREGKYHLTGCSRCFLKFELEDARALKMRCPECGGLIKRGVCDRILELSGGRALKSPPHRPPYTRIVPLAEVLSLVTGVSTLTSKKISDRWDRLVSALGSEINILVDARIPDVKAVDPEAGKVIERFREGKMTYVRGGGGQYGRPALKGAEENFYGRGQQSLCDF